MWLECAVEETDDRGRKTRSTEAKDKQRGIPQVLRSHRCGEYLYAPVRVGVEEARLEERLGSRIVTYADDLVILCRRGNAEEALLHLRALMSKLKLTVNEEKTRICKVRRRVRLLGVHVWADVFGADRPGTPGLSALEKSIRRMVEKSMR